MWCSSKDYNKKERRKKMVIFMTDTHGDFVGSALRHSVSKGT